MSSKRSHRVLLWLKRVAVVCVLGLAAGFVAGAGFVYYKLYIADFEKPDLKQFLEFAPPATGTIYDANDNVLMRLAVEYRHVISYDEIPLVLEHAIMATEDKRFWEHDGIDKVAIVRAMAKNLLATADAIIDCRCLRVRIVQGGSTIDQQTAKLLFLADRAREKSASRKIREAQIAIWLNRELVKQYLASEKCRVLPDRKSQKVCAKRRAKEEILSRYASMVYLGHSYNDQGRYGFKAAADYYFGRNLAELKVDEAALLAGMIRFPSRYAPKPGENKNQPGIRRRNEIVDRMARAKFVELDSVPYFKDWPLIAPARVKFTTLAPHAITSSFKELQELGFRTDSVALGAYNPHLTIDRRMQAIANQALDNALNAYQARHPEDSVPAQGAVVILRNSDGAILAEVGGRFSDGDSVYAQYTDFNRATQAVRQPGSAFKPVVYTVALLHGWKFSSLVHDGRVCVRMGYGQPPKCISNYDGKYKGWIPLRQCLAESRNACTVWLAKRLPIEDIVILAQQAGITTTLELYPTTALGASSVRLIDLANMYRTFTTGYRVTPYQIRQVTDRSGTVIFQAPEQEKIQMLSDSMVSMVQELLRGAVRLSNGTGSAVDNRRTDFPVPVMGKTGTTNDFRDALFIGVTPGPNGITVAIRIGIDDYRSLGEKEAGARAALPVFQEIIRRFVSDSIITSWPQFSEEIESSIDAYIQERSKVSETRVPSGRAFHDSTTPSGIRQ